MSYSVRFRVKVQDLDYYLDVSDGQSITYNVRELIEQSSGWVIKNEEYNGLANDLMPKIFRGTQELTMHPEKYKHLESENGWGTVSGVLNFYKRLISDYENLDEPLRSVAVVLVE